MKPSLTDLLCTRCGLCCDGSLFADVELAGADEALGLEAMGLEVEDDEDDGQLLLQPCAALKGKRCSIYRHRPACCRTFECRLLQEVRRGAVGVDQAMEKIAEAVRQIKGVEEWIVRLGGTRRHLSLKESCAEVLTFSAGDRSDRESLRNREKLEAALAGVERLIQTSFLGG